MENYDTNSITKELRNKIPNGTKFNICEKCGYNIQDRIAKDGWKNIRFYERYKKALCDECVDKLDGTWNMSIYLDKDDNLCVHYPMKDKTEKL